MKEIIVKTPAKVNLFLDILTRERDGFHKIVTLFQAIKLYDIIKISKADFTEISIIPNGIEIKHNIIEDILQELRSRRQIKENFKIILFKNIPIGAGLGGGSSDAAGVLIGINSLLNLNLSTKEIKEILSSIGSDTLFFINGGIQFGIHYGEMLERTDAKFNYYILLVYPGFSISTKEAYNLLEPSLFRKGGNRLKNIINAIDEKNLDKLISNLYNIFEMTEFKRYSILAEIKRSLIEEGAENAILSGTGSTVYGIFKERGEAEDALKRLTSRYQKVILTEPLYEGIKIEEE